MSTIPPELVRSVAGIAHPDTTRTIKHLNRYLSFLITRTDLQMAEMRWRLGTGNPGACFFWAIRNGLLKIVTLLLASFPTSTSISECIDPIHRDTALAWAAWLGHV